MHETLETKAILDGWRLELQAAGRARGTIEQRLSYARRCLRSIAKPVAEITRADIVAWLAAGQWGPEARASARASVRGLWRYLDRAGIAEDITVALEPVNRPRGLPRPAADAVIADAIARADDDMRLAIDLMAICGLRRAETARVRADDVEPYGRGWRIAVRGKGGRRRHVPCPPVLARRIRRRGGYVFPGGQQGHISPGWLGKRLSRVLPDSVTPHMLRHRYATVCYTAGHDLRAVQRLLGHASVATTQIYVDVDEDSTATAAENAWTIAC